MTTRVFVSYCRRDVAPDDGRLHAVIQALQAKSGGAFEIVVDYQHPDAAIGASLPGFIERIDSSDAVVMLLTPGYRDRVVRREDTGVYHEFRRIYDRVLAEEDRGTYGRTFLVLPLV